VVRVVEEQREAPAVARRRPIAGDEIRVRPFVDDDDIRLVERASWSKPGP
jgi:hypothetical protein